MDYMASIITDLHDAERMGTEHVYQSTRNRINDFINGSTLSFNDITTLWLQAFQNYLLKRQLSWNTISTYMRILRAVYYRAVDDGLAPFRPRLFKGVYTGIRGTTKRAIGEQTLRQLKLPTGTSERLENARQLFMLLFMLRGIPFVDIAYMRRRDLNGLSENGRGTRLQTPSFPVPLLTRQLVNCSPLSVQREPKATNNTAMP